MILRGGVHWTADLMGGGTWTWSEKLDGHRAFWDGGVSVGMGLGAVPWSNLTKGGGKKRGEVSCGVWSRYCNKVSVPPFVVSVLRDICDTLVSRVSPKREVVRPMLDVEIWSHRGASGLGVIKSACGVDDWSDRADLWGPEGSSDVRYLGERVAVVVHDIIPPSAFRVTRTGPMGSSVRAGAGELLRTSLLPDPWDRAYGVRRGWLDDLASRGVDGVGELELGGIIRGRPEHVYILDTYGPSVGSSGPADLPPWQQDYDRVLGLEGEGLMLQNSLAMWRPRRCPGLLKVKQYHDGVGRVVGVTSGREGTTGVMSGLIGALVCEWVDAPAGCSGEITLGAGVGFGHTERGLGADAWLGRLVRFTYLGITPDGHPREPKLRLDLDPEV